MVTERVRTLDGVLFSRVGTEGSSQTEISLVFNVLVSAGLRGENVSVNEKKPIRVEDFLFVFDIIDGLVDSAGQKKVELEKVISFVFEKQVLFAKDTVGSGSFSLFSGKKIRNG